MGLLFTRFFASISLDDYLDPLARRMKMDTSISNYHQYIYRISTSIYLSKWFFRSLRQRKRKKKTKERIYILFPRYLMESRRWTRIQTIAGLNVTRDKCVTRGDIFLLSIGSWWRGVVRRRQKIFPRTFPFFGWRIQNKYLAEKVVR